MKGGNGLTIGGLIVVIVAALLIVAFLWYEYNKADLYIYFLSDLQRVYSGSMLHRYS